MRIQTGEWLQVIGAWIFGILPGWLILPGLLQRWSRVICVDALPLTDVDILLGDLLDLVLGPKLLFKIELTLPVAARTNLARVVDLHMRQTLPDGGADLVWRYLVEKHDKSEIKVNVFLLKKRVLEEIKDTVSRRRATLRTIKFAEGPSAAPFLDSRRKTDRLLRLWGMVSVMLFCAIFAFIGWQQASDTAILKQQIDQLEHEKAALSIKAVELRARLDAENTSFAAISRDVILFQTEYQKLPILLDLTQMLSNETWVSELSVNGKNLHLSGFTGRDVTEVMATIRDLPWVLRIDLDGPVSFDSFSRRNRFDFFVTMQPNRGVRP